MLMFMQDFARQARRNRFRLFTRLCSTIVKRYQPLRILDVGGTVAYWQQMDWSVLGDLDVTIMNLEPASADPAFTTVTGDARDLSAYPDHSFDVVHSNSVLGHVGSLADQRRMAQEIRRVGLRYFVQTPNQSFLVDWRTLVPGFHFLPVDSQAWCFRQMPVGRYPRVPDYEASIALASRVRNVTGRELHELFPEGTIVRERVWGLTKSFIVHAGFR